MSLFRMFQRRGLASQWEAANTVLASGELGHAIDTNIIKIGDGLTSWNSLPSINGLSAYEIAKDSGFVGTEAQWLASLSGKSAYEVAVSNGFVGSESEWISSLAGADGTLTYSDLMKHSLFFNS